jgi:DNA-binding CsgD family transcriptional regulator
VPALAPGDAERLLRFVAEAQSFGGDHPFEGEFLTQLGGLVAADWISYVEAAGMTPDTITVSLDRPGDEVLDSLLDWPAIQPVQEAEDPILHYLEGGFDAVKRSDFHSRRELHRTRLYHLMLEPCGLEYSLSVRLRSPPSSGFKVFSFDRCGRDFSERDRTIVDLLNPHLAQLYSASESRRRLRAALALHQSSEAAIVLLESDDRIDFASREAHELLDRYFGENGVRLPDPLTSWLRERRKGATSEPLRVDAGDQALLVELVDGALLLEERRRMPLLTRRELEILDLVAEGKTNAEIAERLWVSPLTVRKHLENVYARLGVHTRTAAAAFVRELPVDTVDLRSAALATSADQDD